MTPPADDLPVNQEKKLADLVVGDLVIWHGSYGRSRAVRKITKVTATQIAVGDTRYRRRDGFECGAHSYGASHISVAKPGEIDRVRAECRKTSLCNRLHGIQWQGESMEVLEAVWAIVKPKEPAAQPAKNTEGAQGE